MTGFSRTDTDAPAFRNTPSEIRTML